MAIQQFVVVLEDLNLNETQAAQVEVAMKTAVANSLAALSISADTHPLASALPVAGIAPAAKAVEWQRVLGELRDKYPVWGMIGRPPLRP